MQSRVSSEQLPMQPRFAASSDLNSIGCDDTLKLRPATMAIVGGASFAGSQRHLMTKGSLAF